jgi:hypothetical protein
MIGIRHPPAGRRCRRVMQAKKLQMLQSMIPHLQEDRSASEGAKRKIGPDDLRTLEKLKAYLEVGLFFLVVDLCLGPCSDPRGLQSCSAKLRMCFCHLCWRWHSHGMLLAALSNPCFGFACPAELHSEGKGVPSEAAPEGRYSHVGAEDALCTRVNIGQDCYTICCRCGRWKRHPPTISAAIFVLSGVCSLCWKDVVYAQAPQQLVVLWFCGICEQMMVFVGLGIVELCKGEMFCTRSPPGPGKCKACRMVNHY